MIGLLYGAVRVVVGGRHAVQRQNFELPAAQLKI